MTDQAAKTDVTVKDNGVNIHEDLYYCQRYLQEETDMVEHNHCKSSCMLQVTCKPSEFPVSFA